MKLRTALLGAAAALALAPAAFAERGADGKVNVLYWQAVSILNPYLSSGTKDVEAASLVLEPLAGFDEKGDVVPAPRAEDPDGRERRHLGRPDHDHLEAEARPAVVGRHAGHLGGRRVHLGILHRSRRRLRPGARATKASPTIETPDDLTVEVTFDGAEAEPLPGLRRRAPRRSCRRRSSPTALAPRRSTCTEQNTKPIGTGPFMVTDFKVNDVVTLAANPNYRDPAKPAFATMTLKGGGDAAAAARAVLETGEFDYAWNTQINPEHADADGGRRQGRVRQRPSARWSSGSR